MKPAALLGLGAACAALAGAVALIVHLRTPHFTHDDLQKIRLDMRGRIAAGNEAIEKEVVYETQAVIISPRRVVGFVTATLGHLDGAGAFHRPALLAAISDIHKTTGFHCDMGDDWHYICLSDQP